ncbi:MAG TPA: hypothetical protein VNS02_01665 [Rhizobiaceae bacterium]|nr:hypothetical protein [Rhizobiaceae bacterium]
MKRLSVLLALLVAVALLPAAAVTTSVAGLGKELRPALAAAEICVVGDADESGCVSKAERSAMLCHFNMAVMPETGVVLPARGREAPRFSSQHCAGPVLADGLFRPPRA